MTAAAVTPIRVLGDLGELERRTGGAAGAQRVAWTDGWRTARHFLRERLMELGLAADEDEAGNLWANLPGSSPERIVVGSHLDSVPSGGALDGALGVLAALEVLRTLVEAHEFPALTVTLVDWADEEGARFGRSLFGSAAATGGLDLDALRGLADAEGARLPEVLAGYGIDLDQIAGIESGLAGARGYLELHIEQGPVLEAERKQVAAVAGTFGVERLLLSFHGAAGHAGSTPMDMRADAFLAAAATALEVETIAVRHSGRGTTGTVALRPGAPTVIAADAELGVDLRHEDADDLAQMRTEVLAIAHDLAAARRCQVECHPIWRTDPVRFDPELVELVRAASAEAGGRATPMVSGALHDAAEVAGVVPTAMVFSPSRGGVSHSPLEHTDDEDLVVAIEVFGRVALELASGSAPAARRSKSVRSRDQLLASPTLPPSS